MSSSGRYFATKDIEPYCCDQVKALQFAVCFIPSMCLLVKSVTLALSRFSTEKQRKLAGFFFPLFRGFRHLGRASASRSVYSRFWQTVRFISSRLPTLSYCSPQPPSTKKGQENKIKKQIKLWNETLQNEMGQRVWFQAILHWRNKYYKTF